jgi:ACS family hexuronate transporter-like MFS transporter
MMLVSTLSYVDRNAIAILIPAIQKETGLTAQEYGWIVAAFSYAYMLGNPIWGILLDQWGVRSGMLAAVSGWTIASAAHALASGLWSFAALRTALGFFEGATFPGSLRAVVQSLAPAERNRGLALSYSGGSLGAILTPFLVTPIAVAYGWRAAFWATGIAGLLWLIWWSALSARPELRQPPSVEKSNAEPFRWRDPRVAAFIAIYAMGAMPLGFILYMSSLYLSAVHSLDQAALGAVLWIPPLGWECGYFFWGWLVDRWVRAGRPTSQVCARIFATGVVLSLAFALAGHLPGLSAFLFALFVEMFLMGAFIVGGVAFATGVFGNQRAGLIAGLGAGSFSAVTALTAPLFGAMLDARRFHEVFYVASLFPAAGYLAWRALRGEAPTRC